MAEGSGSILPTATAAVEEEGEEEEEVWLPTAPFLRFPAHCRCYRWLRWWWWLQPRWWWWRLQPRWLRW